MIVGLTLLAFGIPGEIPALGRDLLRAGDFTGGLQITLDALADDFIQMSQTSGISLAVFHRVGAIACGGLNTMPHDGAVVTYLSYCKRYVHGGRPNPHPGQDRCHHSGYHHRHRLSFRARSTKRIEEEITMTMKSALITGAASGIGRACAERMAREGYGVVVADVNLPAAEELAAELTAEGLSAIAVHMDVADEQEVEAGFDRMVETYGSCDLVMSNAGVQIVHPFEEYPFADWRKMMAIHADGAFLVSRAAYRRMKASGKGGRIVFTGSVQSFVGSKLKEPYNFAKHGVAGLAKAIAREGAEYGIYTYTICPSFIKTPLVEKQIPEQAASLGITEEEVVKNIMLRDTVDGVFTTVEDVANTLVFLSKDQGALTGQSLRLTHGWAMM